MSETVLSLPAPGSGDRLPVPWVPPPAPAGAPVRPHGVVSHWLRRAPAVGFRWLLRALSAVALLALASVVLGSVLGTWGLVPVLTGSMRPGIQPGDLVLVVPEPLGSVHTGQIIDFQPPGQGGNAVVHRVTSVRRDPGGIVIRTKGDANNVADPWHARLGGTRAWRVRAVIPKLGYLAVAEHNPLVRMVVELVLLGAGFALAFQVIWGRRETEPAGIPAAAVPDA